MAPTHSETAKTRAKVLVVDDRPENTLAIQKTLEPLNVEVFTAQSGNEALALLLHHDFAVALLDVQMPEMDGFELAALMRDNEETNHVPIIFITAISREEKNVFKGYGSGAVDYLVKPIDPDIVRSKVRVFSQLYLQREELEAEIDARKQAQEKNEELIRELRDALEHIKTLRGIIPICMHCKKIRDTEGFWEEVEVYVRDHSEAQFSHGLCEKCAEELYPEEAAEIRAEDENSKR